MEKMKWSSALDVGIEAMNVEHQRLIDRMNRLMEDWEAGSEHSVLASDLSELLNYTKQHFASEERLLDDSNYAEAESHKGIHKQLLRQLEDYRQEFSRTGQLTDKFFAFLNLWLSAHIRGIDAKYGAALGKMSA